MFVVTTDRLRPSPPVTRTWDRKMQISYLIYKNMVGRRHVTNQRTALRAEPCFFFKADCLQPDKRGEWRMVEQEAPEHAEKTPKPTPSAQRLVSPAPADAAFKVPFWMVTSNQHTSVIMHTPRVELTERDLATSSSAALPHISEQHRVKINKNVARGKLV